MADVPTLLKELGGSTAISRATGIALTTVDGWRRAEFVPAWRIEALLKIAKKAGKPITAADFPTERPAKPRKRPTPESATARAEAA